MRILGGIIWFGGESFIWSGRCIKESIMIFGIMMSFVNIENIGVIFMSRIFGSIVIGSENESENGRDLNLIGIMRGDL